MGYTGAATDTRAVVDQNAEFYRLTGPRSSSAHQYVIEPDVSVELSGDPRRGVVRIYKQVHTTYKENFPTTHKIGEYQAQIYNHLVRTQPHEHIFFEGLQTNFNSCNTKLFSGYCYAQLNHWIDLWIKTGPDSCADYIRNVFAGYSLDLKPTENQYYYLGALGAERVFAICYEGVTLHRTTDKRFETITNDYLSNPRSRSYQEAFDKVQELREERALLEIKRFLRENPGEQVDLVYGRWHQFTEAAKKVFKFDAPLLAAYEWPELAEKLGWQTVRRQNVANN